MKENIKKYVVSDDITILEALRALNELHDEVLTLFVVDDAQRMLGTLTDGDIRRYLVTGGRLDDKAVEAMHVGFVYIEQGATNVRQIQDIRRRKIALLPCLDSEGHILSVYDMKALRSILPVDAVLMAGGRGERLRPLTEKTPKPLLPVGDKAIIDHNIDRLISYGVSDIFVTVNYLREQLEAHFAQPYKGVQVACVREPRYLGTIGSLRFIQSFHHDVVLVMNSDLFTNINYEDFYLHFLENGADMSVAAFPYTVSIPFGIFELDGRSIRGLSEKPVYNYYINAGIYLIRKRCLSFIPDGEYFNATDLIDVLIRNGCNVIRYPISGYWIDIGSPVEYQKAQDLVKHL